MWSCFTIDKSGNDKTQIILAHAKLLPFCSKDTAAHILEEKSTNASYENIELLDDFELELMEVTEDEEDGNE